MQIVTKVCNVAVTGQCHVEAEQQTQLIPQGYIPHYYVATIDLHVILLVTGFHGHMRSVPHMNLLISPKQQEP